MPKKISLSPHTSDFNSFVANFTDAVAAGGNVTSDAYWNFWRLRNSDIVVLHWPDQFFKSGSPLLPLKLLLKMKICQLLFNVKFVWVAHNIVPHGFDQPNYWAKIFVKNLDGIIHLSRIGYDSIRATYRISRCTQHCITVHGAYTAQKRPEMPKNYKKSEGLSVVNFGLIKRYKNLETLIESFNNLSTTTDKLTISGYSEDASYLAELKTKINNTRIRLDPKSTIISDSALENLVDQADVIILPYRHILNSGSTFFALSRWKPVAAPREGALPELQEIVGSEWLYLYDGDISSQKLADIIAWRRTQNLSTPPDMSYYDWTKISEEINRFFDVL